jgi:hypothetical protein
MCWAILPRESQFASRRGPETNPSRGIWPSWGEFVNWKKYRAATLSIVMFRASSRLLVPSMSSSLGESLGR